MTWMQVEMIISEVRKRRTNTISYHLYVEFKIWQRGKGREAQEENDTCIIRAYLCCCMAEINTRNQHKFLQLKNKLKKKRIISSIPEKQTTQSKSGQKT